MANSMRAINIFPTYEESEKIQICINFIYLAAAYPKL